MRLECFLSLSLRFKGKAINLSYKFKDEAINKFYLILRLARLHLNEYFLSLNKRAINDFQCLVGFNTW